MRIKVESFWQDIKGRKVEPGEYNASELKGDLARYLVDNGHAVVIGDSTSQQTVEMQNDTISSEPTAIELLRSEYMTLSGEPAKKSWTKNKIQTEINKLK